MADTDSSDCETITSLTEEVDLDSVVNILDILFVDNSFDGDERTFPDGASPSSSLYLSNLGQRRESFLYKSDSEFDLSASARSVSRHSSLASESM